MKKISSLSPLEELYLLALMSLEHLVWTVNKVNVLPLKKTQNK